MRKSSRSLGIECESRNAELGKGDPNRLVRLFCLLPLITGCAGPRPASTQFHRITLQLPRSLEPQRAAFDRKLHACARTATEWFAGNGFEVRPEQIIREARVFDDRAAARRELAARFNIDPADIPATFAGTVDGSTLLVVSPELYRETFTALFPEETWSDEEHEKLMVHEIAHAVHARIARDRIGTEEAMGPRWFFEGLAIACAGQFQAPGEPASPLPWEQIAQLIGQDEQNVLPSPTYPTYGRVFRSLRAHVPVRWMIAHAGSRDFVEELHRGYTRNEQRR